MGFIPKPVLPKAHMCSLKAVCNWVPGNTAPSKPKKGDSSDAGMGIYVCSGLSFYYVDRRVRTQAIRFDRKHLYMLSHLTNCPNGEFLRERVT